MKTIFIMAFLIALNAHAAFVGGMEDVPVMENLNQQDITSFGNEESRFVEALFTLEGASFEEVKAFYKETLPQLGWKQTAETDSAVSFSRGQETIDIVKEGELVRITDKF